MAPAASGGSLAGGGADEESAHDGQEHGAEEDRHEGAAGGDQHGDEEERGWGGKRICLLVSQEELPWWAKAAFDGMAACQGGRGAPHLDEGEAGQGVHLQHLVRRSTQPLGSWQGLS